MSKTPGNQTHSSYAFFDLLQVVWVADTPFPANPKSRTHLLSQLSRAHVICLVYSISDPSSFDRVAEYWLPLFRREGINVSGSVWNGRGWRWIPGTWRALGAGKGLSGVIGFDRRSAVLSGIMAWRNGESESKSQKGVLVVKAC